MFLQISRQLAARSSMINRLSRSVSTVADSRDSPKLRVDFFLPYYPDTESTSKLVDRLIVPTKRGLRSIISGYKDTYVGLKPGVLSLVSGNDTIKYFISSGSLFIHEGYVANICTDVVIPLDDIDAATVKKALAEYSQKLSNATTDLEKTAKVQRDLAEFSQKLSTVLTNLGKAEALPMPHSQAS